MDGFAAFCAGASPHSEEGSKVGIYETVFDGRTLGGRTDWAAGVTGGTAAGTRGVGTAISGSTSLLATGANGGTTFGGDGTEEVGGATTVGVGRVATGAWTAGAGPATPGKRMPQNPGAGSVNSSST